jgi:hypothetical protein
MYDKHEPAKGNECYEAIDTQGKSCKKCDCSCYRRGMTQAQATADNEKLVRENHNG